LYCVGFMVYLFKTYSNHKSYPQRKQNERNEKEMTVNSMSINSINSMSDHPKYPIRSTTRALNVARSKRPSTTSLKLNIEHIRDHILYSIDETKPMQQSEHIPTWIGTETEDMDFGEEEQSINNEDETEIETKQKKYSPVIQIEEEDINDIQSHKVDKQKQRNNEYCTNMKILYNLKLTEIDDERPIDTHCRVNSQSIKIEDMYLKCLNV